MKIREINIIEFAGLKDYKRTFESGANVIFEGNGFGKTTIATFIKAMLYGFSSARGSDIGQNLRLKMTPWSGNDFGGTMTVETDGGESYRIERVFNARGYMDILNVINLRTGAAENDLLPVPGDKLLGVGSDNFDRCVYTPQNAVKTGNDSALTARLGRALEDNGGGAGYKKAVSVLEDYLEVLASNEGRLLRATSEIAKVERQIKAADVRRAQQLAGTKRKVELKARLIKYEAEAELIRSSRLPQVEVNKTAALYQKIDRRKQEKLRQIEAMDEYLCGRVLTDAEKASINGYLDRIKELEAGEKPARPEAMADARPVTAPAAEKAAAVRQALGAKKRAKTDADFKKRLGIGLFGGAGVFLAASVFMLAYSLFWVGGMFAGLAALCGGGGLLFFIAAKRAAAAEKTGTVLPAPEEPGEDAPPAGEPAAEATGTETVGEITGAAAPFEGGGAASGLSSQEAVDLNEKELLTEKALMTAARGLKGVDSIEKLMRSMQTYDADVAAREAARKEAAAFDVTLEQIRADLGGTDESVLLRKFMEADFDIKIPQKRLKYLENNIKAAIAQIGQIEGAEAAGAEASLNRTALKQLHNNLIKDRDELENIIYSVDSAVYHLSEGRERLLNNYAPPLKERMAGYMRELSFGEGTEVSLDRDLNICLNSGGEPRDLEYFSQGQQDLTYFSLRMSMLDLIYKKEKPFIVLDEPFVNFDDAHMEMARKLLAKIAEDKQIIYMTSQAAHKI